MSTRTMNVGSSRSVDATRKYKLLFIRHVLSKHQPYSTTFGCKMVQCPPKMNAPIVILRINTKSIGCGIQIVSAQH